MAEPATWLGYVGVVTGGIGAVTGISGAVMGYIGYRQSRLMKSLDLRLQLRKDAVSLKSAVDQLPGLMERAKASHLAVLAANGLGRSGSEQIFVQGWQGDSSTVDELQMWVQSLLHDYSHLAPAGLELMLVEIHEKSLAASRISSKYSAELAADDRAREQIRADVRARGG